MGKQFGAIDATHKSFIEAQHMFFSGSAAPEDKGADGIQTYWSARNQSTLDGLPTGILPGRE